MRFNIQVGRRALHLSARAFFPGSGAARSKIALAVGGHRRICSKTHPKRLRGTLSADFGICPPTRQPAGTVTAARRSRRRSSGRAAPSEAISCASTPVALGGGALFDFEWAILIQDSRDGRRVHLVHGHDHQGPSAGAAVVPDSSLNNGGRYSSNFKILDGHVGR
jgi:hypothetical protein